MRNAVLPIHAGPRVRLALAVVLAALLLSAVHASALDCPRELEVVVYAKPETGFDAAMFLQVFGPCFEQDGITLGLGLPEPEYVLAVTYTENAYGEWSGLGVSVGFVDGSVGGFSGLMTGKYDIIAYYHGKLVSYATSPAASNSLEEHLPAMTEYGASLPGIIEDYEAMPKSATLYLPHACMKHGESATDMRPVEVGEFSPHRGAKQNDIRTRIVVKVARGKITNGAAVGGDESLRAFALGHHRGAHATIKLAYQAPTSGESDEIIVYNSCDILGLPRLPLQSTAIHKEIFRKTIPLCGDYRLEYAHDFEMMHDGAGLTYTVTGEVPFTATPLENREGTNVLATLNGSGTLDVLMAGNFRDCVVTYTNKMNVTISGEIRRDLEAMSVKTRLYVTLTEDYGVVGNGMIQCPDEPPIMVPGVPTQPIVQGEEAKLIFEHRDGETIKRPFSADEVTGDAVWILHVPERAGF